MNLKLALAVALVAVNASAQGRTLMPTQPSGGGGTREAGRPTVARPPVVITPFGFPQSTISMPPKAAITLPADFFEMSTPDPLPARSTPLTTPRNGPVLFTPGPTRHPPVVPETPTNVPAPHCGAERPC